MSWNGDDPGRGRWEEEQARASEDEARASASAEAGAKPEPLRPGQRVVLTEQRGTLLVVCTGQVGKISGSGYVHVEWDDRTDGWFSPAKAAASLKPATGEDALPRHIWIFDVPDRTSSGWDGPLPTLDEPVCAVCREKQTDENEYGPCPKAKP